MAFYEHIAEFCGKRVIDWQPGGSPISSGEVAYRLSLSWDESESGARWIDRLAHFLTEPFAAQTTALIVGPWEQDYDTKDETIAGIITALVEAREQLPALEELFVGEIISEENEISWIEQGDVVPLLAAYPRLRTLTVRGGNGLRLSDLRHDRLETLVLQSGGLPRRVLHDLLAAQLPRLQHLELWLGTDQYGGDITVEDLAPLLSGELFAGLSYLGLRDSEIVDQIAVAVANARILDRIDVLDLSLGMLTDEGATALLLSPRIARLRRLDLHHHFCSEAMVARLKALPLDVDLSEPQEAEIHDGKTYRYIAVSE
jgi:hypothetical protein